MPGGEKSMSEWNMSEQTVRDVENLYLENGWGKPSGRKHKFFDRYLDNDLEDLSDFLTKQYSDIELANLKGVSKVSDQDIWKESGSVSTMKWREYNVFQFYHPSIRKLLKGVKETVSEACEYYNIDMEEMQYYVQGWFNINDNKTGKLNWHDHGGPFAPFFHGYYCVKSEPSQTYYNVYGKEVINENKDNRLIISEMGHPHAMADWDWEGPRITIAYDIMPLKSLVAHKAAPQHWIPLV